MTYSVLFHYFIMCLSFHLALHAISHTSMAQYTSSLLVLKVPFKH